jgi:hypothetical protein
MTAQEALQGMVGYVDPVCVNGRRGLDVRYLIRLNPKAFNPITRAVIASRLWEIEQCSNQDSECVIWHCADVRIDGIQIRMFFTLPKDGEKPWEKECFGICVRGQDNAIEIHTGASDVSGN